MRIIKGDITNVKNGIIVHQVNCQNKIGAGVSGAIIKKWPVVAERYRDICAYCKPAELLGACQYVIVRPSGVDPENPTELKVVNLFSQFNYGNSVKTDVVYTNLKCLVRGVLKVCYENPEETVYVPHGIGCGLAGADWSEVSSWFETIPNLVAVRL